MNSIAHRRRKKGWSQQQLAVHAGLHVQTVSEAEREYRGEPAEDTWIAIARALGCTVAEAQAEPEQEAAVS